MIRLLGFLITGCFHKWAVLERQKVMSIERLNSPPYAVDFVLQCERCGNIKCKRT